MQQQVRACERTRLQHVHTPSGRRLLDDTVMVLLLACKAHLLSRNDETPCRACHHPNITHSLFFPPILFGGWVCFGAGCLYPVSRYPANGNGAAARSRVYAASTPLMVRFDVSAVHGATVAVKFDDGGRVCSEITIDPHTTSFSDVLLQDGSVNVYGIRI